MFTREVVFQFDVDNANCLGIVEISYPLAVDNT